MSTHVAESSLLTPYGTQNAPGNNTPQMQNPAHGSSAPKSVADNGSNITTDSPKPGTQTKNSPPPVAGQESDEGAWGSNFWVTLVDPQTQTSFFACPATGQVSWDPPAGNFVLPPSTEGEWWELSDDSRGGLPYYYQTKTGETLWERPAGFIIPLGIIQNTALGRRLSTRLSKSLAQEPDITNRNDASDKPAFRRSRSYVGERDANSPNHTHQAHSSRSASGRGGKKQLPLQRSYSSERRNDVPHSRSHVSGQQLTPIPGSDVSGSPSPSIHEPATLTPVNGFSHSSLKGRYTPKGTSHVDSFHGVDPVSRVQANSSYVAHRPRPAQSLNAALEILTTSISDSGHDSTQKSPTSPSSNLSVASGSNSTHGHGRLTVTIQPAPTNGKGKSTVPPSPQRPIPGVPNGRNRGGAERGIRLPTVSGKGISKPIPNHAATLEMSPVRNRATGKPIPVGPTVRAMTERIQTATLNSGTYPILPDDLASDIQQFSQLEFAQQYFSTHRTGFIFRRRVPVAQMMTWQKTPLTSPLLTLLNRSLNKDAVKVFKVTQHIMGDRERERPTGLRLPPENHPSTVSPHNASTTSLAGSPSGILEEERWLLGEGLTHGELRDEIYCQVMKQLTGNPSTESIFKGWQLLCVLLITFPPSKNFETYLYSFIQKHITQQEGRVDVMAKYCLRRLTHIAKKGPRGKPPTIAEIETASDAAFHPSTFGESLDAIIRLQERNYPQQKVPIILPFLADGILALGGPKVEGIFRVPGDGDLVSELKLRIDRGYYTLDGITDPHVLASLMKLWLRELCDPLVPQEMYNECITSSKDVEACLRIVERLPTINRRVILFVVSFLQLFLEDRVQNATKMTPANLALVMAPNLLRCISDSMSVVFTNAQYEQIFVYNLLLHLKCGEVDDNYAPVHGLGPVHTIPASRVSKSRSRRPQH